MLVDYRDGVWRNSLKLRSTGDIKEYNMTIIYLLCAMDTMGQTTFCKIGEEDHERE